MSTQTRHQDYRYQYKTVAIANAFFCGNGPTINVAVPENLLDLKAIFMHAILKFDVSVTSPNQKILWIGGDYPLTKSSLPDPAKGNMRFVNLSADPTTRIADLKADITDLKDGLTSNIPILFDQPTIELNLITDLDGGFDVQGELILWKIDFVYITTGIQ